MIGVGVVGRTFLLIAFYILLQLICCQDIISTIAGTGTVSCSGDGGMATSATLNYPFGVTLDSSGIVLLFYYRILSRFVFSFQYK